MLQEGLTHTLLQGYVFHLSGFFFTEGVLREGTPLNLCLNYARRVPHVAKDFSMGI